MSVFPQKMVQLVKQIAELLHQAQGGSFWHSHLCIGRRGRRTSMPRLTTYLENGHIVLSNGVMIGGFSNWLI